MTKPFEDDQHTPSPTNPPRRNENDRKWNRGTQIAVIAGPLVTLLIFAATPLIETVIPQKSSEGNSPTGIQSTGTSTTLLSDPAPSSTAEIVLTEPEKIVLTEPEEIVLTEPEEIVLTETRERTVDRNFRNGHCEHTTNIRWEVRASEGWEIDVTSLALVPSTSSKSAYYGVSDLTKHGFTINGRVSNNGDCVRVLGKVVARDGRGNLNVSGTYNEVRQIVESS